MKENFVNSSVVSKSERQRLLRQYVTAWADDLADRPAGRVRIVRFSYADNRESAYLITEKEYDFSRDQLIPAANLSAVVCINHRLGLVDMEGRELLPCVHEGIGEEAAGRRWVRTDGRWRVFDIARRRFSTKQYEGVSSLGELLVSRDASDMLGAINFDGEEVVPHQYLRMEIRPIGPAGLPWTRLILVLVAKEIDEPYHKEFFKLGDTHGKLYSDEIYDLAPYQWEMGEFHSCTDWSWTTFGPVTITRRREGKFSYEGLLNVDAGKVIVPCRCTGIEYWGKHDGKDTYACTLDGVCRVVDEDGTEIIPAGLGLSSIGLYPECDGEYLIPACRDGKWGYINIEAVVKIPFNYDRAGAFANGKATVETSGDRFVIDRHGRFIEKAPLGL